MLAAVIGGPIGMTGYVLAINYMGASIGAVASAVFPAIGAILAYFFLKEKMQWYRWIFLLATLLGVYGLSYSPELNITDFWLGIVGAMMCAFGWGIEAVILAKCMQDPDVKDEYALQIRQTTSALVYGIVLLPLLHGWGFTVSLFTSGTGWLLPVIAIAAFFATLSYLCYYRAIAAIGASMGPLTGFALNPARDFGPKLFTSLAGWGSIAFTGGLAIPYFLVPLLETVEGAIIVAFLYRKLIGRHLPCECGIDE